MVFPLLLILIHFTRAKGLSETTSLPSEGRGRAASPISLDSTCGITLAMLLFEVSEMF